MSLVIYFQPGEAVRIDKTVFHIRWNPPALHAGDQHPVLLTGVPTLLIAGIAASLAHRQRSGFLGIAFDGSPKVELHRLPAGAVQ